MISIYWASHQGLCLPLSCFLHCSANSMPKQVEVRMHESHLEPIEARPQSKCAKIWSKMFKNLLLTLTVLGKRTHQMCAVQCKFPHCVMNKGIIYWSIYLKKKKAGFGSMICHMWLLGERQCGFNASWPSTLPDHLLLSKDLLAITQPRVPHHYSSS